MNDQQQAECKASILPINDALYVLQGKWRVAILYALTFQANTFGTLELYLTGITPRMLSKELKHLEANQLVHRSIADEDFRKVEYTLTPHGQTLKPVIVALRDWGLYHRATIMQSNH